MSTRFRRVAFIVAVAGVLVGFSGSALASRLVYHPLNPSFGGNPNLAVWWWELANAQNLTNGGGGGGGGGANFGGGIGGPVIIINPGDVDVDGPDVDVGTEDVP